MTKRPDRCPTQMPPGSTHHRTRSKVGRLAAESAGSEPAGSFASVVTDHPAADTSVPVAVTRFEISLKSILTVVAVIVGLWLVIHGLPALLVLITALMLVGALHPLVAWLERRHVRRFFAICLVFGTSVILVTALLLVTVPALIDQVQVLAEQAPKIRQTIASYLEHSRLTASIADDVRNLHVTEFMKSAAVGLLSLSTRVLEVVAYLVATVFLAFYMMIDRDRLRGALFAVVPRRHHIRLSRILLNLATIVGGYIRGQMLTCFLMGSFIFVLLLACRVPNALAIAVFGGSMDLLPYIGVFLTMGPVVLAATMLSPTTGIVVFILMLGYEELESRVLVPLVYGRALRLPSSVILFSLILGTTLAGIIGALLALPLAAAVIMLIEEMRVELPGETIQPADALQRRKEDRTAQEYERRSESLPAEEAAAVAVKIAGAQKEREEAAGGR